MRNRLTEKDKSLCYCLKNSTDATYLNVINKLGVIEDIEDEIGIDIITLYKALKYGVWYTDAYNVIEHCSNPGYPEYNKIYECITIFAYADNIHCPAQYNDSLSYLILSDYGKTWALTKEELDR